MTSLGWVALLLFFFFGCVGQMVELVGWLVSYTKARSQLVGSQLAPWHFELPALSWSSLLSYCLFGICRFVRLNSLSTHRLV